jgi:hypothetical protein
MFIPAMIPVMAGKYIMHLKKCNKNNFFWLADLTLLRLQPLSSRWHAGSIPSRFHAHSSAEKG